uniref:Uncharacterized protein n=1 Tax=Aegilops tauschii subsp. strangulata TaxID=200361 RepID=A0A453SP54_AEGTS
MIISSSHILLRKTGHHIQVFNHLECLDGRRKTDLQPTLSYCSSILFDLHSGDPSFCFTICNTTHCNSKFQYRILVYSVSP